MMEPRRVYRSRGVLQGAVGASVVCAFFIVMAVTQHGTRPRVLGGVLAVIFFVWIFRLVHVGLYVYPDGVKVSGAFLSKRVPWAEIERFEARPAGNWPYVGFVVRRDGRRPVSVSALSAPGFPKSKLETFRVRVQGPIDELNQLLAQRSQTSG